MMCTRHTCGGKKGLVYKHSVGKMRLDWCYLIQLTYKVMQLMTSRVKINAE